MRLTLVGADIEENLGMGMIAAAATGAGHRVRVLPFNDSSAGERAVRAILAGSPDVVGLAAQFQHRGVDFLQLSCALRRAGYRGHITAGGNFATMAHRHMLSGGYGLDSVVLYEGEGTIVDLLGALSAGGPLDGVAGIAFRAADGSVVRTAPRPLAEDLDSLPIAQRYREHVRHMGIPFVPVSGSRGCWASCAFCSITTLLRDARANGAHGRLLRLRSSEDVAAEMAVLATAVGGSAIFCFHDENFLLPRPSDTLERVGTMKRLLDESGVARAAFVGKCRPDTLNPELARRLAELGVIRLYVGIENASQRGSDHLNRRVSVESMGRALDACSSSGIVPCYNLLMFEPETTLEDVAENLAFIRGHAEHPVNFCRAEPYLGTPMQRQLAAGGRLTGSYLGWDYRITDDRAELLFRICAAAFRERNFASDGVHNRYMGVNYSWSVLNWFYRSGDGKREQLGERASELTRSISLDTADLLGQALDLASRLDPHDSDRVARETAMLGLRIAASDRVWHAAIDALLNDMRAFAASGARREAVRSRSVKQIVRTAQGAAIAGWLALWAPGCDHHSLKTGSDAAVTSSKKDASPDYLIADMLPADAGAKDAGRDYAVFDPLPPDAGKNDYPPVHDPVPPDAGKRDLSADSESSEGGGRDLGRDYIIYDPLPPDAARDSRPDYMIADMLPPDAGKKDTGVLKTDAVGPVDPLPAARGAMLPAKAPDRDLDVGSHWTDTAPRQLARSQELPLSMPPQIRVQGQWDGQVVKARLEAGDESLSIRWQSQGEVQGEGREITWTPSSDEDQLNVAVRGRDGVAISELRIAQVRGQRT